MKSAFQLTSNCHFSLTFDLYLISDLQSILLIKLIFLSVLQKLMSNFTSLDVKGLYYYQSIFFIIEDSLSLKVVTSLNQYKFRGDNHVLTYKYAFKADNLALLMKNYMHVMIVLRNNNFILS